MWKVSEPGVILRRRRPRRCEAYSTSRSGE